MEEAHCRNSQLEMKAFRAKVGGRVCVSFASGVGEGWSFSTSGQSWVDRTSLQAADRGSIAWG